MDQAYLNLIKDVLENGEPTPDRTGVGTLSVFGRQVRHNLKDGFPLITTKRVYWKGVVEELLWFLRGETNIASLLEKNVHIWDEWADKNGDLGPVYGKQWRNWTTPHPISYDPYQGTKYREIDQITEAISLIKNNPESRRIIVSAWNVSDLDQMALMPCHSFFQFNVRGDYLDLQLYQRSADLGLGVPFNIASYSLLLMMFAHITGKKPGEFIHTFGNLHIYNNHIDALKLQLEREPKNLPTVEIQLEEGRVITDPAEFKFEDFVLSGYDPHPVIKMDVAI